MKNFKRLQLDYERITNFWFDGKTVKGLKKQCDICVKPHDPNNTDGDVMRHWCYVPVFHHVFVFFRTIKKIKNKTKIYWEYLGYY